MLYGISHFKVEGRRQKTKKAIQDIYRRRSNHINSIKKPQ